MKKILRIFLHLILVFIVFVAALNILYLVSIYFLSPAFYQNLSADSPASSYTLSSDAQSKIDYCAQTGKELNFISVTKYLDTLPPTYYTWKKSVEGAERENKYYIAICSISLQTGRRVTEEANRLAQIYVIPQIELLYGLLSRWWLWVLTIISLRRLIVDLSVFIQRKKDKALPLSKQESSVE